MHQGGIGGGSEHSMTSLKGSNVFTVILLTILDIYICPSRGKKWGSRWHNHEGLDRNTIGSYKLIIRSLSPLIRNARPRQDKRLTDSVLSIVLRWSFTTFF